MVVLVHCAMSSRLQILQCPCSVARSTVFYGVFTLGDSRIEVV